MKHDGGRAKTLRDGFMEHFVQGANETCWLWRGSIDSKGYGRLSLHSKWISAHRTSYIIHKGEIPDGLIVCHSCDNPACVNPDHLFLGTHKDNSVDMRDKDRVAHGERSGRAKLSLHQVQEIRAMASQGMMQKDIAAKFGIASGYVSLIISGKKWARSFMKEIN